MVRENILEFERKHSQNLIELNEWLEGIRKSEPRAPVKVNKFIDVNQENGKFLEYSELYLKTGKLRDCDPLYKKINETAFEDMSHLKMLACYLTKQELKDRLSYENYMLLETEVIIDNYLIEVENKKVRNKIYKLRRELKELEKTLSKPTMEDQIEKIINDSDLLKYYKL